MLGIGCPTVATNVLQISEGKAFKNENLILKLNIIMKTKMSNYRNCFALAYVLLVAVFFVGCKQDTGYTKRYIVSKSDDNNWTTSGIIECDSLTMVNRNKATLWIDGQELNLEGQTIKVFSNTSYVAPK
jgi:hypothetical protein